MTDKTLARVVLIVGIVLLLLGTLEAYRADRQDQAVISRQR
jgi:hypothetical protein